MVVIWRINYFNTDLHGMVNSPLESASPCSPTSVPGLGGRKGRHLPTKLLLHQVQFLIEHPKQINSTSVNNTLDALMWKIT